MWTAAATGIGFPGAAQLFRLRRDTYDLSGRRISKQVVHGITSLTADTLRIERIPHIPITRQRCWRSTGTTDSGPFMAPPRWTAVSGVWSLHTREPCEVCTSHLVGRGPLHPKSKWGPPEPTELLQPFKGQDEYNG